MTSYQYKPIDPPNQPRETLKPSESHKGGDEQSGYSFRFYLFMLLK